MEPENNNNNSFEETKDKVQSKKNSIARNVGEKVIKKAGKKGAKNVVSKKAVSVLLKFAPVIGWVLIVLVILFIILGLIAFFLTMPGLMMQRINEILDNIVTTIKSFYGSTVEAHTSDEDVIELAKYIDSMDYDLIGYGFIKPIVDDNIKVSEELVQDGYNRVKDDKNDNDSSNDVVYYENESGNIYSGYFYDIDGKLYHGDKGIVDINDDNIIGTKSENDKSIILKNGIIYDSSGESVVGFDKTKVDYSRIKTYAMSNNRLFILRNSDTTFLAKIVKGITKILTGYQGSWAMGMLEVYTAEEGKAKHLYDVWDRVKHGAATVEITGDNKDNYRLKLKAGFLNNPMLFELDDWSSRYGLSSDFLVSLHLATLSPELIETMCQTFDIRAQVYLDHITKAKVHAYFYTKQMEEAGEEPAYYEDMKDDKNDSTWWNFLDSIFLSKKEAKEIMDDYGIESLTSGKYTCGGKDPSIVWDYSTYSKEGTPTNKCFTELVEDGLPWKKDVIYDQWSDKKTMWTGDRSQCADKGGTLIYVETVHFDTEEERDDKFDGKWKKFKDFLKDGKNRAGILYGVIDGEDDDTDDRDNISKTDDDADSDTDDSENEEDPASEVENADKGVDWNLHRFHDNAGGNNNEVDLTKFFDILDSLENAYNRVESGVYGCNIVETEKKVSLKDIQYNIFNKDSNIYIGNLMPYGDLKNMGKDNHGYYEVVMNVWPTNDSGLRDGDIGYNSDEDGELVLSMLFRRTTADENYNVSWILYENLSIARMKEERIYW